MSKLTLGSRLRAAMTRNKQTPVTLARQAGSTEATISNWLNDNVRVEHVKAIQLFKIADAARIDARELLLNDGLQLTSPLDGTASHPVKREELSIAIQLVADVLQESKHELPPRKQAEAIQLAYDLLEEGLPRAKVLRFVLAAVA